MSYYLVIGNTCADSAYPFTRNVAQNTSPPLLQIGEFTLPELSTSAQIAHLLPSQLSCRLSSRLLAFVRYSFRFRLVFLLLIVTLDLLANARAQLLTVPPYAVSAVVLTLALSYFLPDTTSLPLFAYSVPHSRLSSSHHGPEDLGCFCEAPTAGQGLPVWHCWRKFDLYRAVRFELLLT